jgi:hypothetical protein
MIWILGSAVLVVLAVCAVLYARALDCPHLSAATPPEIVMFACADDTS